MNVVQTGVVSVHNLKWGPPRHVSSILAESRGTCVFLAPILDNASLLTPLFSPLTYWSSLFWLSCVSVPQLEELETECRALEEESVQLSQKLEVHIVPYCATGLTGAQHLTFP